MIKRRKTNDDRKTQRIQAVVTNKEKEYILRMAEKHGITESEFILRKVFPDKYKSVIEFEEKLSQGLLPE